jgi:hypothetical protein
MKGLIFFLAAMFILCSCDSPRDRRALSSTTGSDFSLGSSSPRVDLTNSPTTTLTTTPTTGTTTTTTSVIPADAQQCHFATDGINGFESTSTHLGSYTLCQSSSDKNIMYFQLQTPPKTTTTPVSDISICFIPTTSSGSNSIYVGNPMCGQFTSATSVRKITFVKFAQYQNAVINGAIFFKDIAFAYPYPFNAYIQTMTLDAYKMCMQAISTPPYYNATFCQAFKQVGQYVFKQF